MYVYNFAGNKFSKVHGTFVSRACRLIYSNDKSISHCNSRFVNAFVVEKKIYILFGFSYVLETTRGIAALKPLPTFGFAACLYIF